MVPKPTLLQMLAKRAPWTSASRSKSRNQRKMRRARPALYETQGGRCQGCMQAYAIEAMTVDHVKPLADGGTNRTTNLQLLCYACNGLKGDGSMDDLASALERGRCKDCKAWEADRPVLAQLASCCVARKSVLKRASICTKINKFLHARRAQCMPQV